jgi:hypothetical protein
MASNLSFSTMTTFVKIASVFSNSLN